MHARERLVVADPQVPDSRLAEAAQEAGAWALIDQHRPHAEARLKAIDPARTLLRVRPEDEPRPDVGMAVLSRWTLDAGDVAALQDAIQAWQAHGVPVAVEVRDTQEARRAHDAGADALVARGGEGPGRASPTSSLVLLPALQAFDLPIVAWGGAGPSATGALLVHADVVVLDAQLYALPEAGLSDAWTRALRAFDGGDVRTLGATVDEPFYALARPADEHVHGLWEAEQAAAQELGPRARSIRLQRALEEERGHWTDAPLEGVHALGADAAHADFFAGLGSLEAALEHLEARLAEQTETFPLTEGSPLAEAHGTELPVVQGAMANVSEVPAFARAVADEGALPFLAFASLRPEWATELMEGTLDELDEDQPFGCGIIGLDLNEEKRDAHQRLIREEQPDKALIAAGTVEQARELEDAGVDTYLHTPSRGIVRSAIEAGLDHVVVEGNECGGHIGKLPSLVLWDVALQEVDRVGEDVRVLLAGGVSDDETAAMAGTLAAGIEQARVGVLMGTAYLATEEIVATGAITPAYQRLVLASQETEVTGETTGIRARSAPTPFTDRVRELEHELVRDGVDLDERKERVEDANLGATRLAARGVERGEDREYHEVPTDKQLQEGNYLMGQGAELIEDTYTIADLHREVTEQAASVAAQLDERLAGPLEIGAPREVPEDAIAIVGMGAILPDAPDVDAFWSNILEGHVAIEELPEDRWPVDAGAHLSDREDLAEDGTYTVLGGFVDDEDVDFDPIEHRIPPAVADQMDASQQWAITAAHQALADADLLDEEEREDWGVLLGNALGGEQRAWTERRLALREALDALDEDAEHARDRIEGLLDDLPAITEDTMPGELANVIASRVCHVFDIGGPARTTDAACASTLAALEDAVQLLRSGSIDVALSGGVDRSMDPAAYAKFSAIGALSDEGSFPFDERASGFVMGEGCGILVLKRLEDALADGDDVYACIRGVGSSSDGKGKGITAPNPSGQRRAVENALADAEVDPTAVSLVEAHGTATPVGDPTEVQTLEAVLEGADPGAVGLGSVKSNVGHLKAAAGAAGLVKIAKAIEEATLPPTVVEHPTSEVAWETSPLSLVTEPQPWDDEHRIAGVSAFGFGGTNSHVVLSAPPQATGGRAEDPTEPRLASAPDRETLLTRVEAADEAGFDPSDPVRVAYAPDVDEDTLAQAVTGELPPQLALVQGVAVADLREAEGSLGLVFPGQGSQYPRMALEIAEHFPAAREVLAEADQVLTPLLGEPLTGLLAEEGEDGIEALTPTEVCQPAVLAADVAVLRTLEELGVEPDVVAGHSLGEYAALVAAGTLSFEDALHAVSARGQEMADVEVEDPGGLVALETDRAGALDLIEDLDAWPANVNGPEQTVVAGTTPALETLQERADEREIRNSQLQVSAAFHSPIVEPATGPLREVLERIPIDPPEIPVVANATGEPYPEDPDAIRDLLARQVASPVEWVDTMEHFAEAGVDLVVEAGPGRVLSGLAQANLGTVPAVPSMHQRTGELATFTRTRLALTAAGHAQAPTEDEPVPLDREPTRDTGRTPRRQPVPERDPAPRTVVTGVSLGVPGVEDPFAPEAKQALLDGENLITEVPEAERERMANMGVQRLDKDGPGGPSFQPVDDPDDVVHLAGRIGEVDLSAYGVEEDWLEQADRTARLGVVAALEALTDASIPLVPDERETSTGATLHEGFSLPDPMQGETGVILASAFPGYDNLLDVVEDHQSTTPRRAAGASPDALVDAIDRLGEHLDPEGRAELMDWAAETHLGHDREPAAVDGSQAAEPGAFPRDFLFRVLGMGHAQIAQLLDARGPNLHVNAACASTTSAIALAQDWIEQGRCERVIVVGADVGGDDNLLPWIASGFMAAGAASTAKTIDEAALPFDERRNGMLVGSGAVGLVIETHDAATERGVTPLAEIEHTRVANSAYHGARLDPDHVSREVAAFLDEVRQEAGLDRAELAEDLVFVSHEPATPPRGGSAEAEIAALRAGLSDAAEDVLVTNTKGLTGHAMGAGLEDGIAVELLRRRQAPPIANLERPDPDFEAFTFSQGEETERSRSMRFAAGFGSQVAMACFARTADRPGEVDQATFEDWLSRVAGDANLQREDRLLRLVPEDHDSEPARAPDARAQAPAATASQAARQPGRGSSSEKLPERSPTTDTAGTNGGEASTRPAPGTGRADADAVRELLVDLVSRKTGYPEDVIEPGMDLEADLGVDTVKQAEVLAEAREELGIGPIEGMSLADVPTVDDAARLLADHTAEGDADEATLEATNGHTQPETETPSSPEDASTNGAEGSASGGQDEVRGLLIDLVSRKTGYPEDVIEPGMDLEADLGVDTVKQAEVLAEARGELGIGPIEGMSLADVPTVDDAARLLAQHAGEQGAPAASQTEEAPERGAESSPEGGIQRTRWTWKPAPPPRDRLAPSQIRVHGELDDELMARLEDDTGEDEPLHVVPVDTQGDPEALADLLVELQQVPDAARVRLLAPHDAPAAAGLGALAGTLRAEELPARAVIVGPEVPAARVADELLAEDPLDVRLDGAQRRTRARAPTAETDAVELAEPLTVLAPGGLGAAVEPCLAALAEQRDVQLVILGRSPLEDTDLDPDDEDAVQRLREDLLAEAKEAGGDLRPAEIEERVQREVRKARRVQAYQGLAGRADVAYHRADATDADALASTVASVGEDVGEIDLVVHGVGLDRSRSFADKGREEMQLVLDAKLTPVRVLTEALPEAHHVAFGSIAGAYGNPGQADYALANGCLPALLEPVDGTVIHWTAWDAAGGMADDDTVRAVLEEREVAFLDPEHGAEIFTEAFDQPGTFLVADRAPDTCLGGVEEAASLSLTGEEAWLEDHRVGERPLVPGVRYVQAIRETATRAGQPLDALHGIRFAKPAWVTEPTTLTVQADEETWRVTREDTVHAQARPGEGPGVKPVDPSDPDGEELDAEAIYERLFHGPSFQVLQQANVGEAHVAAQADVATGGAAPWAMAIEAAMQAAGLAADAPQLPVGIEAASFAEAATTGEARVDARLVGADETGSTWDATVRAGGEAIVHVRGLRLQRTDANQAITSELVRLAPDDVALSGQPVQLLDPRSPRAKREAEREAGTRAAERVIVEAIGREAELTRQDGRPLVDGADGFVSITHGHGVAIAAASREAPLGVDLERVEERSEAWREGNLGPAEQDVLAASELSPDVAETLAWTLKEAASKAIGTGLDEPATSYEVTEVDVDEGTARAETPDGAFTARWTRIGELVVSLAQPEG